ncbi:MAG: 3-phosphoshikimate 1-carboxyvinyltransferase [Erysipelotrichaceae bacterium]|nr:3-phosphoshikimate 1-carboxyvinyltransferase [Erysipelotrichaceae bacterium]
MKEIIKPSKLYGEIKAPSSKSFCHRLLIGACLCKGKCVIDNVLFSDDILATIDCLKALGGRFETDEDRVIVDGSLFLKDIADSMNCHESGSTIRFMIPLVMLCDKKVDLYGSKRLMERPFDVYEDIAKDNSFLFEKHEDYISVKGKLKPGRYKVRGDISSQFITGLLYALSVYEEDSVIEIIEPIESKSYIDMTLEAMAYYGVKTDFKDNILTLNSNKYQAYNGMVEADESNAAFLDAFNVLGNEVNVKGLNPDTLQGDSIYHYDFKKIKEGKAVLDLKNCPDLGPIYMALGALNHGLILKNTRRLKAKECDRGMAMKQELEKIGAVVKVEENEIEVIASPVKEGDYVFESHNDHRIVMAMSVVASVTGGTIMNAEAVRKSYPHFFEDLRKLHAKVDIEE